MSRNMIGLILVTHGRLAEQFVTAMEHVVGTQGALETVCIGPHDVAGRATFARSG